MRILLTGGAGFIGSAVTRYIIENTTHDVLVYDKLTYAGNLNSLAPVALSDKFKFIKGDICDKRLLINAFESFRPQIVMHLAAESHVDRSIDSPGDFINTNIIGSYMLLEVSRDYWDKLSCDEKKLFRFHHVSTDEVFGDLSEHDDPFTEESNYSPNSPYSASKASADHLVRAWFRTYGLPVVISNCSNNYGPYQFPEKLIPHTILNALFGKELPVYGDGSQIRDWLYVDDHAKALLDVATKGAIGQTYNIGGLNERTNLQVVTSICHSLDKIIPKEKRKVADFESLISFVEDRPGHDVRYAIDASKISKALEWKPRENFESGLDKTIHWYLENTKWWGSILSGEYSLNRIGKKVA